MKATLRYKRTKATNQKKKVLNLFCLLLSQNFHYVLKSRWASPNPSSGIWCFTNNKFNQTSGPSKIHLICRQFSALVPLPFLSSVVWGNQGETLICWWRDTLEGTWLWSSRGSHQLRGGWLLLVGAKLQQLRIYMLDGSNSLPHSIFWSF